MKYLLIILAVFTLSGCVLYDYCIITKEGVVVRNIKSLEDCESIIKFLEIKGICVQM